MIPFMVIMIIYMYINVYKNELFQMGLMRPYLDVFFVRCLYNKSQDTLFIPVIY